MTTKDSLGDRMKRNYEDRYRIYLTRRTPVIIRIDGKAFHSFTKGLNRPYDMVLKQSMWETAKDLCENIMGCQLAYIQSDEISLLLTDYRKLTTEAWFDYNLQKICSVSASMATRAFNVNCAGESLIKQSLTRAPLTSRKTKSATILSGGSRMRRGTVLRCWACVTSTIKNCMEYPVTKFRIS